MTAISAGSTPVLQSGFLQHNNFGAPVMIYARVSFQKRDLILIDGFNSSSEKRLIRTGMCDSKSWHRNRICEWR